MFVATLTNKKDIKNKFLKMSPAVSRSKKSYRLAVIDLGTNSVRLDIYAVNNKKVSLSFRDKTMIRLGDGVYKTGRLSKEGQRRCLRTFMKYGRLLKSLGVEEVVAFGTSALRSSANSKALIREIEKKTGISVRVISGQEEGRLIAMGIMANENLPRETYALIDIGGGSTEISICRGQKILSCESYKLGANRLQQNFFKTYPAQAKRGELHPALAIRQHIRDALQPLSEVVRKFQPETAIGSSGTIRTAARILRKLGYDGRSILRMDLCGLVAEMQTMNLNEIKRIPGLEEKRKDIILPGLILLEEILFALQTPQLRVTEFALREGILVQALSQHDL
jgi:exopolyphosphatase/guanosine-5'-triphosphate,3'-diphosphate pyrophosphatase